MITRPGSSVGNHTCDDLLNHLLIHLPSFAVNFPLCGCTQCPLELGRHLGQVQPAAWPLLRAHRCGLLAWGLHARCLLAWGLLAWACLLACMQFSRLGGVRRRLLWLAYGSWVWLCRVYGGVRTCAAPPYLTPKAWEVGAVFPSRPHQTWSMHTTNMVRARNKHGPCTSQVTRLTLSLPALGRCVLWFVAAGQTYVT